MGNSFSTSFQRNQSFSSIFLCILIIKKDPHEEKYIMKLMMQSLAQRCGHSKEIKVYVLRYFFDIPVVFTIFYSIRFCGHRDLLKFLEKSWMAGQIRLSKPEICVGFLFEILEDNRQICVWNVEISKGITI